jgi:hypothetical protein
MSAKGRGSALPEVFIVDFWILRGDIACEPGRLTDVHEKSGIIHMDVWKTYPIGGHGSIDIAMSQRLLSKNATRIVSVC